MKRPVGTVAGVAVVAGVALHRAGVGPLAAPPLRSWGALEGWYDAVGPGTAIVAMLRLVAMVVAVWLATAGGLQVLAPRVHAPRLQWLADSISPQLLRSLAKGAAGLSVTAGLVVPAAPVGPAGDPAGTAVMVPLDVPPTPATSSTAPVPVPPPVPVTSVPALPPVPVTSVPVAPPAPVTPVPIAAPEPPPPAAEEVVVVSGDSFWSIAVDEASGRDLIAYWSALIEANRDRLVDPSNPDLLYPNQVLRLP